MRSENQTPVSGAVVFRHARRGQKLAQLGGWGAAGGAPLACKPRGGVPGRKLIHFDFCCEGLQSPCKTELKPP